MGFGRFSGLPEYGQEGMEDGIVLVLPCSVRVTVVEDWTGSNLECLVNGAGFKGTSCLRMGRGA